MKLRPVALILALILAAFSGAQDHDRDLSNLPPLVRKSFLANKTAKYSGERMVQFKHGPDRVSHVEYILKDGIRTRIEFPDDSEYKGQIIVDDGHQRLHYYPDRNEIDAEPAHLRESRPEVRMSPEGARVHPQLTHAITDGGILAGWTTQLVTVSDPNGNVMQRMWIEPNSGVVLKRVLYDQVGTQVGYYEFTKINFKPTYTAGDFRIVRKGGTVITPAMQARRLAAKMGLSFVSVPPSSGFLLENSRSIHPGNQDVLSQTYIGESGRFTLFQLRGEVDQNRLQKFAHGRLSTYSWSRGPESFALVGDLGQDKLREIARLIGDSS
jgi:outer membrane lipoprotein-sorting protein